LGDVPDLKNYWRGCLR